MMINTERISESETKAPRHVICPLLHSAPKSIHIYRLPTAQFIDTVCSWGQNSFKLSKHPFFSAVLGWHGAQVSAMPSGKPCDIEHS